jgi:putative transposase
LCFADLPDADPTPQELATLRAAETIGRPLGSPAFLDRLEARLGRAVRPAKRGRTKQMGSGDNLVNSKMSP